MAKLGELFGVLSGSTKAVLDALNRMDAERTPAQLHVEGSQVRFKSRLMFKDGQIVFAKPDRLPDVLAAGSYVRFKLPEDPEREVRLKVLVPHVNLASGNAVFFCKTPEARPAPAKRKSDRFDVSAHSNILLVLPQRAREFRLVDISGTGCNVMATRLEAETYFPVGKGLSQVYIQAGSRAKVELEQLTPRIHRARSVGCEFAVQGESTAQACLAHLIKVLERSDAERLKR